MADIYEFGSGFLTGIRNDAGAVPPITPRPFGTLQDVSIEFSGETKELYGQLQFPVDTARGKTKISGKAKAAGINGATWADLYFGSVALTTGGQVSFAHNELGVLGSVAPAYTVIHAALVPLVDLGVFYVTSGVQFKAALTPAPTAPGTYYFDPTTGIYTFDPSDGGTSVYVNYTYKSATGINMALSNQPMGNTPTFQGTFYQQYEGHQIVLVLNKCVSTSLRYPTRLDDYTIPEMDFAAFADAGGNIGTLNLAY